MLKVEKTISTKLKKVEVIKEKENQILSEYQLTLNFYCVIIVTRKETKEKTKK